MQNQWWQNKAAEIQSYADNNDTRSFYDAIKQVYGPARNPRVPVRSADGALLIKDRQRILTRWADHFSDLLNHVNPSDPSIFDKLPTLPYIHELCLLYTSPSPRD